MFPKEVISQGVRALDCGNSNHGEPVRLALRYLRSLAVQTLRFFSMPETITPDPIKQSWSGTMLDSLRSVPKRFWFGAAAVLALFASSLIQLVAFSLSGSLYSHIVLIPAVSIYLVISASGARGDRRWQMADRADSEVGLGRATALGVALLTIGVIAIQVYWFGGDRILGAEAAIESRLAWQMGAFLFAFWGICLVTLPRAKVKGLLFPLGFLVFMVPFPPAVLGAIETFLQHGSADAAYGLMRLAGTPVFREELLLQLPGINLEVAPQCSGIRSSLVLFITSTLASYMFLRTNWKRAVLVGFIIPLGMLRNGFRIFVLGELCVRIGPEMIDSAIHHRGGPIFFALSLVPLFLLLWILWKSEKRDELQRNEGTKVDPSGSESGR
ncbi:MAG: archaeosortase/exosortase family protein [Opitutaceae bacterium]